MKYVGKITIVAGLFLLASWFFIKAEKKMVDHAYSAQSAVDLFALSASQIKEKTTRYLEDITQRIDTICNIPNTQRTYANTFGALDTACSISDCAIWHSVYSVLEMVSPHAELRDAAHAATQEMSSTFIEIISNNKKLFNACREYAHNGIDLNTLTDEQQFYITHILDGFKRAGLDKSDAELAVITALKKEVMQLGMSFDRAIAEDTSHVLATQEELEGVDPEVLQGLEKNDAGLYIITLDYPTVDAVGTKCTVGATRKKVSIAFGNRAYPANETVLKELIGKRAQLAHSLGYPTYAALNLDDQMAKNTTVVKDFLADLLERSHTKARQEYEERIQLSDPSITKLPQEKIAPWDSAFLNDKYKKEVFNVDDEVVKQYFPMEHTVEKLLEIYSQFLNLTFKKATISGAWHDSVRAIQVFGKEKDELLGTLFVDLYPRAGKFTHACQLTVVPAVIQDNGQRLPGVAVVLANFPKPVGNEESLLRLHDVNTFFHEFGHAIHGLLGATTIGSLSGTNTKTDFVELPSQLLEEWLDDAEILALISKHYKTGAPLPEELIKQIVALKNMSTGSYIQRQVFLALLSLAYYESDESVDLYATMRDLYEKTVQHVAFNPDTHFYASFGHLYSYGAQYYGYLWSKVFALDVFSVIKKYGLLNNEIGMKYANIVLAPGGTKDPNVILREFLGRTPSSAAFFESLGI